MPNQRLKQHPILKIHRGEEIEFQWRGKKLTGYRNETVAAALIANNIHIFGHHHKDGSPQGIYCANGQCAQCMVLINQKPVKACVEMLKPGLDINPLESLPQITQTDSLPTNFKPIKQLEIPTLIIGGGPAGLACAITLAKYDIKSILVDDKQQLGGKLLLQTHRFFGSTKTVYAGTRGIDIAKMLESQVLVTGSADIWRNSTVLSVFQDKKIGILFEANEYRLVIPNVLVVACGAREKTLIFPGNTLPGVVGAGAFQTLLNRDYVKPAQKILVVGGGNVGLIAAYHALQAGIEVAALIEIMSACGGYQVHLNKLARLGVPILNSHTIIKAEGDSQVQSAVIAPVNSKFQPILTEKRRIECDMVLIAVGLDLVDELAQQAFTFNIPVYKAGDADHIAEASAAMLSGQVCAHQVAQHFGKNVVSNITELTNFQKVLEAKPGLVFQKSKLGTSRLIYPVMHCNQEIPCDPCAFLCPIHLIKLEKADIRSLPIIDPQGSPCTGCLKCVAGCPGLAITIVDRRTNADFPTITLPFELDNEILTVGSLINAVDNKGEILVKVTIEKIEARKSNDHTTLIQFRAPSEIADAIAGINIFEPSTSFNSRDFNQSIENDAIVCRCERVTAGEIRRFIASGIHDLNELKTVSRAGMGACGGKTCQTLILHLLQEAGVSSEAITPITRRPLFIEVPLGIFAGLHDEPGEGDSK